MKNHRKKLVRKAGLTWTRNGALKGHINLLSSDPGQKSPAGAAGTSQDASPEEVGSAPTPPRPALPGTFDRRAKRKQSWTSTKDGWDRTAPTGDAGPDA